MASILPTVCVACGGPAKSGCRRVVKEEVESLWFRLFQKEVLKRGHQLLNSVSVNLFMCRTCFGAYLKAIEIDKVSK